MTKFSLPIDDTVNLEEMSSRGNNSDYQYPYQNNDTAEDRHILVDNQEDNEDAGVDIKNCTTNSVKQDTHDPSTGKVSWRVIASVSILFFVNLLNYTDRFTIAGVLPYIKQYYSTDGVPLNNADAGLLQTSFILFYMVFSPIFGFLGDRMNRNILMTGGILAWSAVGLASSFIPHDMFWLFVVMRGLVGIGEASYSTIAPTIIADMLAGDRRTKALTVFFFAIPVGSGLGYIVGAELRKATGHWQNALRLTPALGVICALMIFFLVKEPERGAADGGFKVHSAMTFSSWVGDIKYLLKNKSFMFSTFGFVCVAFCTGALAFWAPTFVDSANQLFDYGWTNTNIAFVFGVVTCVAGIVGVLSGTESARRLRCYFPTADPLVCAFGLIVASPFLFLSLYLSQHNITTTWICVFIASTMLCLNWAVSTDILLYVVIPNRRSTGEAFQILVGHTFGDAGSPYLVGLVSDAIMHGNRSDVNQYFSLQYALYMMCFVAALGGGCYLANALVLVEDRKKADLIIKAGQAGDLTAGDTDTEPDRQYNSVAAVPT